jgi:hypothetical protein
VTNGNATVVRNADGTWKATGPVTVKSSATGTPGIPGAVVTGRIVIGLQPFEFTCTTDTNGNCSIVVDSIPADVTTATLSILQIDSSPPSPGGPYPSWNLVKP